MCVHVCVAYRLRSVGGVCRQVSVVLRKPLTFLQVIFPPLTTRNAQFRFYNTDSPLNLSQRMFPGGAAQANSSRFKQKHNKPPSAVLGDGGWKGSRQSSRKFLIEGAEERSRKKELLKGGSKRKKEAGEELG